MDMHLQLRATDGTPLEDASCYRHLVGSLVYLTVTCTNITHAVHILSQFVSALTSVHFGHLLYVLRYLRGTSSWCLFYACDSPLHLHAYSDSTWASDPMDRCSIAFFLVLLLLHGSPRNKLLCLALLQKQNFEHLLLQLQRLYGFDGYSMILVFLVMHPHLLQIANDPVKHELTKHIGVDAFFTRSHCHQKTIDLQYVPSELQLADFFTKAQTREQHRLHLIKLNASDPPLPP